MRKSIHSFSIVSFLLLSIMSHAQVFTEDFESGIPNTWAIFDNGVGTGVSWEATTFGSANTAYILYDCSVASDAEDWLVTPQITPTATDNMLRFFQTDHDSGDFGSVMTIRISTQSQTNPADFTTIYTQGESALTFVLTPIQIDLSAYVNQPIYIAFVMTQNCGDRWYIDDVEVRSECTIDVSVTASGNTLTANQAGATYEWIECSPPIISGETNQSITLTDVNQFARVKITTSDGCTETSGCYSLATLGIDDRNFKEEFSLYPNPTADSFQIATISEQKQLSIYNLNGQKILHTSNYQGEEVDVSSFSSGVYIIKIVGENTIETKRFVKK